MYVGRPASRLASAMNRPMKPVAPTIMVRLVSETIGVVPHILCFSKVLCLPVGSLLQYKYSATKQYTNLILERKI